jgi:hypothetical protein
MSGIDAMQPGGATSFGVDGTYTGVSQGSSQARNPGLKGEIPSGFAEAIRFALLICARESR